MKSRNMLRSAAVLAGLLGCLPVQADTQSDYQLLIRGRYLLATSGCNDCHTPGYPEAGGKVHESKWLVGSAVGFQGPWGTTYPANLRLMLSKMSEQQWLQTARKPMRPPMPWFSLRDMSDTDLRAIYAYVRKLGPAGIPAPAFAPPGIAVKTPYFEFVPKNLPQTARADQ
ncbi:MAG: c-type cytochrome [Gammaproteobacteria bacterium]|nr:c-type cytochrome [Gammaproteobacteria bacterium]